MATSTQIFNKEVVANLAVTDTFTELMKVAVGKDSIYIRAKETLTEFLTADASTPSPMTQSERAQLLANTLAQMSSSITNQAMTQATQIAKENRDAPYELAKTIADVKYKQEQTDKIVNDNALVIEQIEEMKAETIIKRIGAWKTQADIYTQNGVNVTAQDINSPILTTVVPTNKLALDIVQAEQLKASKFSALASTFRRDGAYTWSTDINGDVTVGSDTTPATWTPLTKAQTNVAIRQERGFDDNMRQHAANSSANMIGLLLSTENFGAITTADVAAWRSAVAYLNTP